MQRLSYPMSLAGIVGGVMLFRDFLGMVTTAATNELRSELVYGLS